MGSRDIFPTPKDSERAKPVNPKGGEVINGSINAVSGNLRNRSGKGSLGNEYGKANNAKTAAKRSQEVKLNSMCNISEHATQSKASLDNPSPVVDPHSSFQSPVSTAPPLFQVPGSSSSVISGSPGQCQFFDDHFDTSSTAKVLPFEMMLVEGESSPNSLQTPAASAKSKDLSAGTSMNVKDVANQKYFPLLDLAPSPKTACANGKKEVQSEERLAPHNPPQLRNLADELVGNGKFDPSATQQDDVKPGEETSTLLTTTRDTSKCKIVTGNGFADTCRLFLVSALASTCTLAAVLMVFLMSVWSDDQDKVFGPLPT